MPMPFGGPPFVKVASSAPAGVVRLEVVVGARLARADQQVVERPAEGREDPGGCRLHDAAGRRGCEPGRRARRADAGVDRVDVAVLRAQEHHVVRAAHEDRNDRRAVLHGTAELHRLPAARPLAAQGPAQHRVHGVVVVDGDHALQADGGGGRREQPGMEGPLRAARPWRTACRSWWRPADQGAPVLTKIV